MTIARTIAYIETFKEEVERRIRWLTSETTPMTKASTGPEIYNSADLLMTVYQGQLTAAAARLTAMDDAAPVRRTVEIIDSSSRAADIVDGATCREVPRADS